VSQAAGTAVTGDQTGLSHFPTFRLLTMTMVLARPSQVLDRGVSGQAR
jgi:hypothetical protein